MTTLPGETNSGGWEVRLGGGRSIANKEARTVYGSIFLLSPKIDMERSMKPDMRNEALLADFFMQESHSFSTPTNIFYLNTRFTQLCTILFLLS